SPELVITPDWSRLRDLGLSAQTIGNAVRIAYEGVIVGHWPESSGKERDIRLRLPEQLRDSPTAVADLPLIQRADRMLTIGQVATEQIEDMPTRITRV